uniref:Uncharacterized protein n=1 Tax=Sciurus vulgaris TaxID=55149 RepID=A0A8D2AZH8_SCIVU
WGRQGSGWLLWSLESYFLSESWVSCLQSGDNHPCCPFSFGTRDRTQDPGPPKSWDYRHVPPCPLHCPPPPPAAFLYFPSRESFP